MLLTMTVLPLGGIKSHLSELAAVFTITTSE